MVWLFVLVLFTIGGNVSIVLGPKWRLHYYAHMLSSSTTTKRLLAKGEVVGAVGNTGNAQGKAPHYITRLLLSFHILGGGIV